VTDGAGSTPARFSPEETGPASATEAGGSGAGALDGRLVLVAGATSASGEAVARALAAAGATVLAVGTRQDALDRLAAAVPGVDTRVCDLADRDAVAELAMRIHLKFGRIDGLVHLVGGWRGGGGIAGQSDEDWEFLERGFRTLRNTTRVFYDDLVASPAGRLAIVSSTAVEAPAAGGANYAAAKAAADAWTRAVAQGFAKHAPQSAAVVFVVKSLAGLESRLGDEVVGLWAADAASINGTRLPLPLPADA
jgi:NADP-dependent 3-hydroxy acid dehydrogenase YdfG